MFKKALIAEDIDSVHGGVVAILENLGIKEVVHVKYCDEALLKIKKALHDDVPFDLLITDLSFERDHREREITSGYELLTEVKAIQPELKTLIYSIENRNTYVKRMFDEVGVDGFVSKGRNSLQELKKGLPQVYVGERYLSEGVKDALSDHTVKEIDDLDLKILSRLADGLSQDQISEAFRKSSISPNSLSTIEKRINKLKGYFKANNPTHLIAITKDLGVI